MSTNFFLGVLVGILLLTLKDTLVEYTTNKELKTSSKIKRRLLDSSDLIATHHPLDPLNETELSTAIDIINSRFKHCTIRFHTWEYIFPDKYDYLSGNYNNLDRVFSGDISVLCQNGNVRYYNILISVLTKQIIKMTRLNAYKSGFPATIDIDTEVITGLILSDSEVVDYFENVLKVDLDNNVLVCLGFPPLVEYMEYLNVDPSVLKHRLAFGGCFDFRYVLEYPLQNQLPFVGIIDLDSETLIEYLDCNDLNVDCIVYNEYKPEFIWSKTIPLELLQQLNISLDNVNECKKYDYLNKTNKIPQRPKLVIKTLDGKTTLIKNGNLIKWQEWTFHSSFNIKIGPILSDIRFNNRSIVYQLHLSEIYVPYQDSKNFQWHSKHYLDGAQFNGGNFPSVNGTLNVQECPEESIFITEAVIDLNDPTNIFESEPYACVFERWTGNQRVRHVDLVLGFTGTAKEVELVYRTIVTVGHYDYVVDYVFKVDGTIKVGFAATGYDQITSIINDGIFNEKYCNKLSNHYCATRHDHYFSFRVDLDVEQINNTFYTGILKQENIKLSKMERFWKRNHKSHKLRGRKRHSNNKLVTNVWYYDEIAVKNEKNAKFTKDPYNPKKWVVRSVSDEFKTSFGQQTGYEISPHIETVTFWDTWNDIRDNKAAFSEYGLWVTKYNPNELYASGKYNWQSRNNNGLPQYIKNDEHLVNSDIVAWVTLGFHHVTRTEDAPLLVNYQNHFVITPFNFYDYTPSVCGSDIY